MNINDEFINNNVNNYTPADRSRSDIRWIVIHYTANPGSTARNNAQYYQSGNTKGVSAHYFVDKLGVWRGVREKDIAGHCGKYVNSEYLTECRNANSIGIETCCHSMSGKTASQLNGWERDLYFDEETYENLISLTKDIMARYDIPVERVIRHYDVHSGRKMCPRPFIGDDENEYYHMTGNSKWNEFKSRIASSKKKVDGRQDNVDVTLCTINGWAWDGTDAGLRVVHYIFDANGKVIKAFPGFADVYRNDLKESGIGNGKHSFSTPYALRSLPTGNYTVATYVFDTIENKNVRLLGLSPFRITHYEPFVGRVKVNDVLNVRTGPGTNYNNLKEYPKLGNGNLIIVNHETRTSDGSIWYQITISDKYIGWVHSGYVEKV